MSEGKTVGSFVYDYLGTWEGADSACQVIEYFTHVADALFPNLKVGEVTKNIRGLVNDISLTCSICYTKSDAVDLVKESVKDYTGKDSPLRKKIERVYFNVMSLAVSAGDLLELALRVKLVAFQAGTQLMCAHVFAAIDVVRKATRVVADITRVLRYNDKIQNLDATYRKKGLVEAKDQETYRVRLEDKKQSTMLRLAKDVLYLGLVALEIYSGYIIYHQAIMLSLAGVYIVIDFTQQAVEEMITAKPIPIKGLSSGPSNKSSENVFNSQDKAQNRADESNTSQVA